MATTIQVSQELKKRLDKIKGDRTYEQVISDLLKVLHRVQVAEDMRRYGQEKMDEETRQWLDMPGPKID